MIVHGKKVGGPYKLQKPVERPTYGNADSSEDPTDKPVQRPTCGNAGSGEDPTDKPGQSSMCGIASCSHDGLTVLWLLCTCRIQVGIQLLEGEEIH